jgi:hypothetical protein
MLLGPSRQAKIEEILKSLIDHGSFTSAVVASKEGLPIAMMGQTDTTMIAAVAASMKDLAERAHQGLTEITTRDDQGHKIVSRYFLVDEDLLLLAVQLPANRPYRRLTSWAIKRIKKVWSDSN